MSFAWFVYTLGLMLVAALACAVNASSWAVFSKRKSLFAAVAFGCYLFELAGIFYSEYLGDKLYMSTYLEGGLRWPVWEIAVSAVLVGALWAWAHRRAHGAWSTRALLLHVAAFALVSVLLAPYAGRAGVLWNILYWSWRDLFVGACFVYPLWYAARKANDADRADIVRSRTFLIVALVLVALMLAWDTLLIACFDATSFKGMARDFWWHATERNIPENLLMVLCAACSLRDARDQALAFANHPVERTDDSEAARLDRRITERLPRFGDRYDLSKREREVFELALKGLSTAQIADALYISSGTVKAHLHRIYRKVDVANRDELTLAFWRF